MCGVAGGWGARGGLLRCAPRVPPCVREDCASGSEDLCGSTGRPRLSITPLHARKTSTSGSHRAFLLPLLHCCTYVLRENHRFSRISPPTSPQRSPRMSPKDTTLLPPRSLHLLLQRRSRRACVCITGGVHQRMLPCQWEPIRIGHGVLSK